MSYVNQTVGAVDPDFDIRVLAAESVDFRDKPHGPKGGADANGQQPTLTKAAHPVCTLSENTSGTVAHGGGDKQENPD